MIGNPAVARLAGDLAEGVEHAQQVLVQLRIGPGQLSPGQARPISAANAPGRFGTQLQRPQRAAVQGAEQQAGLPRPVRVAAVLEHRVGVAAHHVQQRRLGLLEICDLHNRMRVIGAIPDVIAFVEAKPAAAVPLAGENIEIAVAVEIHGVGPGDHHDRVGLDDRDPPGIGELRLLTRPPAALILVEADAVLEFAGDEVLLAVAVPVDKRSQIGP